MRHWRVPSAVATAILFSCATAVHAAAIDPQFNAFYIKFKAAVAKGDKQAVASMTKLPFMLDSKMSNKQQFIAKYSELFPKATVKCLQKEKPSQDKSIYEVFCGEQIYIFEKVNGKWMFTEIGVND